MVRRGQGMRPIWTFLSPREALRVQDVQEARRLGAVRQMFWAAFGHRSRTPLVPLVGNVNAIGIYELYSFILPWFLQSGDIVMHDNSCPFRLASIVGTSRCIQTYCTPLYCFSGFRLNRAVDANDVTETELGINNNI